MAQSFEVTEPLTKRLSGLLKEYPPGITILRELLQNADDAEATKISYCIDTNSYRTDDLVDRGLAEYQGPSLLVYNNSIFSENDFDSLKRLGDSQKVQEKIATGKFGLGFSSVYGWTDSPQILTGSNLVALSPHRTLQDERVKGTTGLRIDFVSKFPSNADSFSAFNLFAKDPRQSFNGTVVRLPLRTQEQAKKSKIIELAITPDDVLKELKAFQKEVTESLLFLKNIETIEFHIDNQFLGVAEITNVEECSTARATIKAAITAGTTKSLAFQLHIRHRYHDNQDDIDVTQRYHLQHKLADINANKSSKELREWAMNEGFFPWIALAAPLDPPIAIQSRIFVSLPLPIFMKDNRVNIHGMFALTRDRRSLWTMMDAQSGGKITNEIQWNTYLFKNIVPVVWQEMLVELAKLGRPVYDYFPIITPRQFALDETLTKDVLDLALKQGSLIWYASTNIMVSLAFSLVALEEPSDALLDALKVFSIPVVNNIPVWLSSLIRDSKHPCKPLTPSSVRIWLRSRFGNLPSRHLNTPTAVELLKYVLNDKNYNEIHSLPLFPYRDGQLRALMSRSTTSPSKFEDAFYISTDEEFLLFGGSGKQFLDLSVCHKTLAHQIERDIDKISAVLNLRRFDLDVFRLYARDQGLWRDLSTANDIVMSGTIDFAWINRLWKWLDSHGARDKVANVLDGLYIIPLQDSKRLHKIMKPYGTRPLLTSHGPGGTLILQIFEKCGRQFPLVDERLKAPTTGFLRIKRCIADSRDLSTTLQWITPVLVSALPFSLRDNLRHQFSLHLHRRESSKFTKEEKDKLIDLPIYRALVLQGSLLPTYSHCCMISEIRYRYISLHPSSSSRLMAVPQLPVTPVLDGIELLDAADEEDARLLTELGHAPIPTKTFLEKYIIPNIERQPPSLIDPLIQFIFDNVTVNETWYKQLENTAFIAVRREDGISSSTRRKPSEVIDRNSPIAELYFDDEEVFGDGIYAAGTVYHNHLKVLGVKSHFDAEIADNRIHEFADIETCEELYKKCELLLECLSDRGSSVPFKSEWKDLLRLPAISVDGGRIVLPASECRPESFKPVVENALGIVPTYVKTTLQNELGWNAILEPNVLGKRIDAIVTRSALSAIETALLPIFEYIKSKTTDLGNRIGDYVKNIKSHISVEAYFPGSIEGLWSCDEIFFQDAQGFEPYISILPRSYASFADVIKLFGVADTPSPHCLVNILSKLPTDQILEATELDISIKILRRVQWFDDVDSTQLRIPSTDERLYPIDEFSPSKNIFAHPRVPETFAFKYQVPRAHDDTAFLQHLSETDEFEDYCQEEQITTRIANTLKEYSLSTSFNEFIANAEDCGSATRVSWYLDTEDIRFPSDNLFSNELSAWQTPSLYVYNDGVFSEDDFKAFINTGVGSKADDSSKIGRHGLGSLTMYHFTDIPSMISGDYFIIFDPSRRYLPLGKGRRRAGMRIPLSLVKAKHKDHLVPFAGIGGYSPDMSRFEGTIFRFPIRHLSQFHKSPLVSKIDILKYSDLSKQLGQTYFRQAKRSLILLNNLKRIEYYLGSTASNKMMVEENLPSMDRQFHSQWKVASEMERNWTPDDSQHKTPFEDIKSMNLRIVSERSFPKPSIEKNSWLIVAGFLSEGTLQQESSFRGIALAEGVLSQQKHRTIDSIPDVAVATQLSLRSQHPDEYSYYSSLPLPAPSGLPISCHGHFATSSDRRSIRIDGASGDWNRFLAESCLPELYFALLEHLCIESVERYYSFWPSSTPAENPVTQSLQSSFWQKVRYSSRRLILSDKNHAVTISQTIFDGRVVIPVGSGRDGPVVQAVRCLRPFSVVLFEPKLNAGLLRHSDDDNSRDGVDVNVLNPAFVRELLRESLAKSVLSCYDDASMQEILGFVLGNGPLERLVGCYIWRLASGDVVKIAPIEGDESKIAYIVDNEGYKLFEHVAGGSLIRPQAIKPEVLERWDLGDDFNIRRLDGTIIDKFVELTLPHHPVKIFSSAEKAWILDVWKYVSATEFVVKFYEKRPTLALKNEKFKFVSSEGLNTLPVMGWDVPPKLSEICSKLNIFILAKSAAEAVVNLSKNWDCEERFLECLLRLKGNDFVNLRQTILDPLGPNEIKFLREFCLDFYKPSLSPHIVSIIRNLPVWNPPISLLDEGIQPKSHTVAASEALIIPNHEHFFPDLTPARAKYKFVDEAVHVQKIIAELGGSQLFPGEYAFDYVLPYLPEFPTVTQLKSIRELLDQLLDLKYQDPGAYRRSVLKSSRLVPDRTGRLRRGGELYSSTNPIFSSAFLNDDTAFPHDVVKSLPLEDFGVQSMVTKANFFHCVRRLQSDVQQEESNQEAMWVRCHNVWINWNQAYFGLSWTAHELAGLANIRFVPVLQDFDAETYRDERMRELRESRLIATMNEVISSTYLPIAWTQRIAASVPPARFLEPIGFIPTVVDVVEHLIQLSTTFASKCSISERQFFEDLAATYNYLNQSTNIIEASEYLQAHHNQKSIWLNDDMSFKDITEFIQAHDNLNLTAASLTWLPSSSILHGVPYDLPTYGLFSAKLSLEPYRNLLRACGSHVVENIKAVISSEGVENHSQRMMERMRDMLRKQDNMCDMKIVIEGREFQAHRVLLGAVSPYFHRLCCGDWKEKSTGVLSLDGKTYGTSDSVRSVIEWVYNGFLELDDGVLEDEDDVKSRLDHYLDVLELSNIWDISELRAHIENRILTYAHVFVRVENVTDVYDIASRYNAASLKEYCEDFIERNKQVVELVDNSAE